MSNPLATITTTSSTLHDLIVVEVKDALGHLQLAQNNTLTSDELAGIVGTNISNHLVDMCRPPLVEADDLTQLFRDFFAAAKRYFHSLYDMDERDDDMLRIMVAVLERNVAEKFENKDR
nr:hypothetical protein B0A51_07300 [Rachicladosporium sp. CCFEE 5018]